MRRCTSEIKNNFLLQRFALKTILNQVFLKILQILLYKYEVSTFKNTPNNYIIYYILRWQQ